MTDTRKPTRRGKQKPEKPLIKAEKRDYLLSLPVPEKTPSNICIDCAHARLIRYCESEGDKVLSWTEGLCGAQFNRSILSVVMTCELFEKIATETP